MVKATEDYCEVRRNILWGVSKRRRTVGSQHGGGGGREGEITNGLQNLLTLLGQKTLTDALGNCEDPATILKLKKDQVGKQWKLATKDKFTRSPRPFQDALLKLPAGRVWLLPAGITMHYFNQLTSELN